DNVGSVVAQVTPWADVATRALRDPFGDLVPDPLQPDIPPDPAAADQDAYASGRLGFGDHPREDDWGLVDMAARYYNPPPRRFITPDSVIANAFDRRDHTPFAYVRNNPVTLNDPTGHISCDSCGPYPGSVSTGGGGPQGPAPAITADN